MTNGEDKRALALLRKCDVLSDIPAEAMTVRPATLEDVFLHLTGRELQEG